jgi:pimeloyl-ACP methyl ester carboxylesterase
MPKLTVPGAELYYETTGLGPLLVMVSGANGSVELWQPFIAHVKAHFTVCSYDRRGFVSLYDKIDSDILTRESVTLLTYRRSRLLASHGKRC